MKRLKLNVYTDKYGETIVYARKKEEKIARKLYPTSNIVVMRLRIKQCVNKIRMVYIYKRRLKLNKFKKSIKLFRKIGIKKQIIDRNIKIKKYRNKRKGVYGKI